MKDFDKNDGLDELRSVFSDEDLYGDDDDVINILPKRKSKARPSVEGPMKIQRVNGDMGKAPAAAQSRPAQSASRPAQNPARKTAPASKPAAKPAASPVSKPATRPTAQPASAARTQPSAAQTKRTVTQATGASAQPKTRPQGTAVKTQNGPSRRPGTAAQTSAAESGPLLRPEAAGKDPDFIEITEIPKPKVSPRSRKKGLTVGCIVRRSLLVFFTVLFFAVGVLLAVCNTLANGPSQTARDKAVMSALQASATKWVPGLFLPDDVVEQIKADSAVVITDVQPITSVSGSDGTGETEDRWANAIDGMIYENVNGTTFKGYVLLIKDPARVSVAISSKDFANATMGKRIFEIADEYNAVAAINAGEFRDDGGVGTGYAPMGLTYSEGECVWNDGLSRTFMGFTDDHKLFVAEGTTYKEAEELGIRDAVSFQTGNTLITNDGENVTYYYADSNTGVAQRTAIGQCADGTVIFLVTDGRTASSMGATKNEIIDTLASYGAVTAGMLDGGSSSMLYYRDYYDKYDIDKNLLDEYQLMGLVNKYKAFTNPRRIPTFFIVNP